MKYRTKPADPVTVDAFRYNGTLSIPAVSKDSDKETDAPEWAALAFLRGELFYTPTYPHGKKELYIKKSVGKCKVEIGSYIVKSDEGEIYSCPAEHFERCFEEYPAIQECKPIRRLDEILLLDENELTPEEKERIERVKKIPEHVKDGYINIKVMLNREVLDREKFIDDNSDYLEGFTEGVNVNG